MSLRAALLSIFTGWCWDRPVLDCLGAPELLSHYFLSATVRIVVPSTCCCDDEGHEYACQATAPATPIRFLKILDPGSGLRVCTDLDPTSDPSLLPDPPPGAVAAWPWPSPDNPDPVIAVDLSGNDSGTCP